MAGHWLGQVGLVVVLVWTIPSISDRAIAQNSGKFILAVSLIILPQYLILNNGESGIPGISVLERTVD